MIALVCGTPDTCENCKEAHANFVVGFETQRQLCSRCVARLVEIGLAADAITKPLAACPFVMLERVKEHGVGPDAAYANGRDPLMVLSTTDFIKSSSGVLVAEISQLRLSHMPGSAVGVELVDANHTVVDHLKFTGADTDGEEVCGWNYEGVRGTKLSIIND